MSVLEFTVPGAPIPKARPRVVNGRTYTPDSTRKYERDISIMARATASRARWLRTDGPCALRVAFYVPDHKRRDTDNLAKAVLDALNGIAWDDDSQVVELHALRYVDAEAPRTLVRVEKKL